MKVATNQDRLNELFDSDPRNDTAIAVDLGVSKQTISAWRNGTRSPKKPMLLRIAEKYHVSLEWLMGFEEEVGIDLQLFGSNDIQTEEARILAKGVDRLSPEERKQMLDMAKLMFKTVFDKETEHGT